ARLVDRQACVIPAPAPGPEHDRQAPIALRRPEPAPIVESDRLAAGLTPIVPPPVFGPPPGRPPFPPPGEAPRPGPPELREGPRRVGTFATHDVPLSRTSTGPATAG